MMMRALAAFVAHANRRYKAAFVHAFASAASAVLLLGIRHELLQAGDFLNLRPASFAIAMKG